MRKSWKSNNHKKQRGDTLVEVAIAMAVLGVILASTMMVVNRSLLGVMNAVERTAIRGSVNSQIEMLKYVFDTQGGVNNSVAQQIINKTPVGDSDDAASLDDRGCQIGSGGFYLGKTTDADRPIEMVDYSNVSNPAESVVAKPSAGNGIWIEGIKHSGSGGVPGYIDFFVRACWSPYASNEVGQGRSESVVRVYY